MKKAFLFIVALIAVVLIVGALGHVLVLGGAFAAGTLVGGGLGKTQEKLAHRRRRTLAS